MRKTTCLILSLVLALSFPSAIAQSAVLAFVSVPEVINPGSLAPITFTATADTAVELVVLDTSGQTAAVIAQDYEAAQGETTLGWDGIYYGQALNAGDYTLKLSSGSTSVTAPLAIGSPVPIFTQVMLSDYQITADTPLHVTVATNIEALLTFSVLTDEGSQLLGSGPVSPTPTVIQWDGRLNGQALAAGDYTLELTLSDTVTNAVSVNEHYTLELFPDKAAALPSSAPQIIQAQAPAKAFTPAYYSTHDGEPGSTSYWDTPMDITDEAAVWAMLMSPMTIIEGDQKKQIRLLSEPDDNATPIGDITRASQSVRVLETLDNGWSLVETYSSSFHDSKVKAWNAYVQGYVKTDLLKQKEPGNKEFAMVVDKLTQRLYVFQNGKKIAELLCSTGLANDRQPYNETRSGEFFLISAVGQFYSDNLICSFGIRFNSGDLLHEVPHLKNADGTPNYRNTEPKLGERASHGCIRVQRLKNPDGINMQWIWNKIYKGIASKTVKLVIWEDIPGRQIPVPDADTLLYYNPDGGSNYHSEETCSGVKDKYLPLQPFKYSELDTAPYSSLTACAYCAPHLRVEAINAINQAHLAQ